MNIREKYEKALPKFKRQAIALCSQLADDISVKIYIVGGIVRDILLNRQFNDVDILVEYDAVLFADLLQAANRENIKILAKNEKFKTVKVEFNIAGQQFVADIASTRSEIYEYPSALPILVDTCVPLKKDISRRDFTINSLAMSLNKEDFCEIYDETKSGLVDLERGLLRVLHPDSFMDDPSRIVRGLKYRAKLNFNLEEDTEYLQQDCLVSGKYDDDCQERIKKEVKETLNLLEPYAIDKFFTENIYKLIVSKVEKKNIPNGSLICEIISGNIESIERENIWIIILAIIFDFAPIEFVSMCSEKLALRKKEQTILTDFFLMQSNIETLSGLKTNYEIYSFFQKYSIEAIVALQIVLKDADDNQKISLYLNKLKDAKLVVSGVDISKFGIENGVIYKKILDETLKMKLNFNFTDEQEKYYFKDLCKKTKEKLH